MSNITISFIQRNANLNNEIPLYSHQMANISTSNNAVPWQREGELKDGTEIGQ